MGIMVIILWLILLLQSFSLIPKECFGIRPRVWRQAWGIFTAPFFHSGVKHLIANTLPLWILGAAVGIFYGKIAVRVWLYIYLASGFWLWVMGRPGCHIGASGLIYGLAFFLFFAGVLSRDRRALALSLIVAFLYGSIVWGVLPGQEGVSWEGHLLGALAGVVTALLMRKPIRDLYREGSPEPEENEDDDSGIWNYRKHSPPPKGMKHPD